MYVARILFNNVAQQITFNSAVKWPRIYTATIPDFAMRHVSRYLFIGLINAYICKRNSMRPGNAII